MRKSRYYSTFILPVLLICGCAVQPEVATKDDALTIEKQPWRTIGAYNSSILEVGVRKSLNRFGSNHRFEPKFYPVISKEIKVQQLTIAFGDETRQIATNAALKAGNAAVKAALGVDINQTAHTVGTYHLFRVFDVFDLVKELNSDSNRDYVSQMASYGPDARIVLAIATVFDFERSKNVAAAGANLSISVVTSQKGSNDQTLKISGSEKAVGKLSDGTVFAFQYARICWKGSRASPVVGDLAMDDLHADSSGNGGCAIGTFQDAKRLP